MSEEIAHIEREADEDDSDAVQSALDDDLDLEAPEADSAEQQTELLQQRDDPVTARPSDQDEEADPADLAEQRRVVAQDEDDYR
ncbi:hypothetical protein [Streptomyces sp. NBC_01198]|uniref:hypothetical protein n=1 Tax=Streptomyces sp. NBC_01198 TaxID=2903769 RepID=UPI002E164473|nr:hypothetical protein OG702_12165 [Streptomyces sp. NBC_01198]